MKVLIAMAGMALLVASAARAQPLLESVQESHIKANVPPASQFSAFLQRDLLSYFKHGLESATSVEYQLLRSAPTQSGVAYPKYYLWVRVLSGTSLLQEGAIRLAAIEKTHFEVTTFILASSIRERPDQVSAVFPSALIHVILAKAGVK
jgi:hypothetical protein